MFLSIAVMFWIVPFTLGEPQADRRGVNVIVVTTEPKAHELRDRIRAGESFELLAIKYSVGRSASEGGYLGAIRVEDLRQELQRPLERLKPGEVSAVTKVGREFFLLRWSTADEDGWRTQYNAGLQALQQKHYPEAVQLFSAAMQAATKPGREDPRYARSLLGLSQSYRLQGNYDGAEPLARQSAALYERLLGSEHPGVIPSLENLAAISQARGRHADAEQTYRKILSIRWGGQPGPVRVDVAELLEDLATVLSAGYFRDAQFDEAFRKLEKSIAKAPLREELYAGIRDGLLKEELVTEAEAVMRRAVVAFPNSREVRYALAETYAKAGKVEKAVGTFEEASRMGSPLEAAADRKQRSVIFESIGSMNSFLVRFDDALAAYKTSLEFNPDNVKSRVGLADLYFRRGRLDEALAEYTRAISTSAGSAAGYRGLAEVHLQLGRFRDSAAAAEKANELDPGDRRSRYVHAIALIRTGRTEEGQKALQEYERLEAETLAVERRRREILELKRSAAVKLVEGQQQEAIELFRRALDSHPDPGDEESIYLNLGLAQAKLGLHREAAATFQTMIERGINDFLIHRNLAVQYEVTGDARSLEQRAIYLQKYDAALKAILK